MDNAKRIRQFLIENSDLLRSVLKAYPGEAIKIPYPHLVFRESNRFDGDFECFSLTYFKTFRLHISGKYFEIYDDMAIPSALYQARITDDSELLHSFNGSSRCAVNYDNELCCLIMNYVKAGAKDMMKLNKEEENNGNG